MSEDTLPTPATRHALLAQIDAEFADFTALLLARPEAQRAEVWDDGRSFKDLAAHVADWSQYALARIQNGAGAHYTPPRIVQPEDMDRVNAEIQIKYADLRWADAWAFLNQSHAALRAQVEAMSEAEIFDTSLASRIFGDDENHVLDVILWNSSQHYREHADEIRATT